MILRKRTNQGFTLLEILLVVGIAIFFLAALLTFYHGLLQTERGLRFTIKSEGDIAALRNFLKKELQTIGFGIASNFLVTQAGSCSDTAVLSSNNTAFCYLSLYSFNHKYSGCWWIISNNGSVLPSLALSRFSKTCDPVGSLSNTHKCVFLDQNRIFLGLDNCNLASNYPSSVAVYYGTGNSPYPASARVILSLFENLTEDKSCHPDLSKKGLGLQIGTNPFQPLVSCVYDFRVKFINKRGEVLDIPPPIQDLSGVRICLILQVGGRSPYTRFSFPTYSERCGNLSFPTEDSYYFYPFRAIEEEVSFPNLRGWP